MGDVFLIGIHFFLKFFFFQFSQNIFNFKRIYNLFKEKVYYLHNYFFLLSKNTEDLISFILLPFNCLTQNIEYNNNFYMTSH